MPNSTETQSRTVSLHDGRAYVVLNERDGRDTHFHGVVVAPAGVTVNDALNRVDEAYARAVAADPDEWNYDDVLNALKAGGFTEILAAEWWEHRAG